MCCAAPFLLLLSLSVAPAARGQAPSLPPDDRARLAEAFRLSANVGERVWPGWVDVAMPVLLVGDSTEWLVGHPSPPAGFVPLGRDSLLGRDVLARPRTFPPAMLATFPFAGVPTIVVGSATRTGKRSAEWVVTLLHEHFHQVQYSRPGYWAGVAALDLARGDSTGMWMLQYPFPYDSAPVARAAARLATALDARRTAEARMAWRELAALLALADLRYLEFQLWQEGVARWVEYAATRVAAADGAAPSPAFRALADYEPWTDVAARQARQLHEELVPLQLTRDQRVVFYPLGAAIALLLDQGGPAWKRRYRADPYRLAAQLTP